MQYCINLPVSNKIIRHITDWKQIHRQHRGWSHHSKPTKQSTGQDKQPPTYSHSTILIHQLVFSSSKVKCTHNSISLSHYHTKSRKKTVCFLTLDDLLSPLFELTVTFHLGPKLLSILLNSLSFLLCFLSSARRSCSATLFEASSWLIATGTTAGGAAAATTTAGGAATAASASPSLCLLDLLSSQPETPMARLIATGTTAGGAAATTTAGVAIDTASASPSLCLLDLLSSRPESSIARLRVVGVSLHRLSAEGLVGRTSSGESMRT